MKKRHAKSAGQALPLNEAKQIGWGEGASHSEHWPKTRPDARCLDERGKSGGNKTCYKGEEQPGPSKPYKKKGSPKGGLTTATGCRLKGPEVGKKEKPQRLKIGLSCWSRRVLPKETL